LRGGAGRDILQGQAGDDKLYGGADNNLLDGGAGDDTLEGGGGNELFIGGAGSDTITTGSGQDIIAFNRGDGHDKIVASTGQDNTLSLGNGITCADLRLTKNENDLTLVTGANDHITFADWYLDSGNHSIATLQMVIEGSTDYDAESTSPTSNKKIVQFNFDGLVAAFDQARAENPTLTSWALSSSLPEHHLGGSDIAMIGGDLAYQYARTGSLSAISRKPAQAILADTQFGRANQNLLSASDLQDASSRLI
jgi:hypothetical protein